MIRQSIRAGKCMLKTDVNRCQLPYYIFRSQHVKGKYNHCNECDNVLHWFVVVCKAARFSFGTLCTFNNNCFLYLLTRAKKLRPIKNTLKITILIRTITNAVLVIKLSSGCSCFYLFSMIFCSCYKMRRRVAFLLIAKTLHVGWNYSCYQYLCSNAIFTWKVCQENKLRMYWPYAWCLVLSCENCFQFQISKITWRRYVMKRRHFGSDILNCRYPVQKPSLNLIQKWPQSIKLERLKYIKKVKVMTKS